MFDFLWRALVMGAIGTAFMDVWAIALNRLFGLPPPNWALAGRWFVECGRGRVFHDDMAAVAPYPNELAIGWIGHYAVGVIYAAALLLIAGPAWAARPTFLPAWILGMVTVGAGWFLMQPGMGAGWASSKRPNPMLARALTLIAHTVFAVGLYAGAWLLAH
ncbi:MAG: hypothetical protein BGP06_15780 [Rhizobiales bacterium 65-9]|nr:DUF2938 domain-containing protein [Hyphomicrobiales bacterium]OJY37943.1 MAG: hypothetical protein BGP06_15780 [Rhizobiales bacterium 65-9]